MDESARPIVEEELGALTEVRRKLDEVPYDVPPSESELLDELVRLREEIATAKEEDKASIMAQYDRQYALLQQLRATRDKPQVDPASPYFAHVRLSEDGRSRDLFLGKATRLDHGLRIVDWRNAPVSRIFYAYEQGDVYEETFGTRLLEGTVEARRTLTIQRGALHRIDGPEGTFARDDDGTWHTTTTTPPRLAGGEGSSVTRLHPAGGGRSRRLGTHDDGRAHRADKRLPDIAGLIDPDQFDLITRPASGFLVVRGTAGSGKTTVALHRIAYLAYDDPDIDSPDTLFVVFSKALRDYVGRVLPALGLGRVRPVTFPEWAAALRRRHFRGLPRQHRDDTPEAVVRLKSHPATLMALEQHIATLSAASTVEQAVDDWVSVTTSFDLLRAAFDDLDPTAFDDTALRAATDWCRARYDAILAAEEGDEDAEALLDAEDDALLLRAFQLRVGPLRDRRGRRPLRHRHIAVDEVQDFSPAEVRVLLGTLAPQGSITLAGDTQQHVMAESGFTSWADFFRWLGLEGTAVDTLRVAYRSSRAIVTFALALLGELREDDPPLTVREGPDVELFRFTDHGAAVAFLADALRALARDEPLANVALLVPSAGVANTYFAGLRRAEVPRLRRVVDQDFAFTPGVEIVPVDQVKGLEFDYVVVVEANAHHYPDRPAHRRLLHVAATRAIHQLWVTSVGTPSPILRPLLESR